MRNRCQIRNCGKQINPQFPGAAVGYVINGLTRQLIACPDCTAKILYAPRGTWEITRYKELKPIVRASIIT